MCFAFGMSLQLLSICFIYECWRTTKFAFFGSVSRYVIEQTSAGNEGDLQWQLRCEKPTTFLWRLEHVEKLAVENGSWFDVLFSLISQLEYLLPKKGRFPS